jgi:hypothetical protein
LDGYGRVQIDEITLHFIKVHHEYFRLMRFDVRFECFELRARVPNDFVAFFKLFLHTRINEKKNPAI